ncbi:7285_t:CDS:2 [Gigaspora rosea]|nr:7285_t:CDS:2 [Gigaspora rosea]
MFEQVRKELNKGKRPYGNMYNGEIIEAKLSKKTDNLIEELKGGDAPDELSNVVQKCCVYNPFNRIALEKDEKNNVTFLEFNISDAKLSLLTFDTFKRIGQ